MFFSYGNCKKGLQVCIGKWKRPSKQVSWGEENLSITGVETRKKNDVSTYMVDPKKHHIHQEGKHYILLHP